MSRYIEADAYRKKWADIFDSAYGDGCCEMFKKSIDTQPAADVVEVVRCCDADKGDCMFNHWHETPNGKKYHICNLNQLAFSEHDDFYCAYGKRREK